jgi:peptide-methionine (S)-S-oxide reductase
MNKSLAVTLWILPLLVLGVWMVLTSGRKAKRMTKNVDPNIKVESIVVGGGCFWCVEAVYQTVPGVLFVQSGYSGGRNPNPTYEQVCSGTSGHAEVLQVDFDSAKVSLDEILDVFFRAHDATTLNRQGNDVGTQYRSVIYYANEAQKESALRAKETAKAYFKDPIVTEISPLKEFYPAEAYHQNYYNENPGNPYCFMVIRPKLEKFKKSAH